VVDARGRRLRAWLALAPGRLLIRIDAAGASYPIRVDPLIEQGAKITGGSEVGHGLFGATVALSANGSTALVGGPSDNDGAGAVWVFTRSGATWTEQGPKLTVAGAGEFGGSVALSADGNTAVIGGFGVGAGAWVFTRSGSEWSQQGPELGASDQNAAYQAQVAISGDGNTILIGTSGVDDAAGAAAIFSRSGGVWRQQGGLLTGGGESGQGAFGSSVALSANGSTALIGGTSDNGAVGAAWVFMRAGTIWTQQGAKLTGGGESGDAAFGAPVALSADGSTALIGGAGDHNNAGAVWAFTSSGTAWGQQGAKLTADDETQGRYGSHFGSSIALSDDGDTALIGGLGDNDDQGAAWLFARSGSTWSQQGAKVTEGTAKELFGQVALAGLSSPCSLTALVGAEGDSDNVGAVFPFVSNSPPCAYADVVTSTPGLLGYWRLGESSGATAVDQTGAHNGTYEGGYTLGVPGAIKGDTNTAVALNGTTGYVKLPKLGTATDWTVEGWSDLAANATGNNTLYGGYGAPRLLITPTGFYADDDTNGTAAGKMNGQTVSNRGSWVYWALVRDGSTLTLYRDHVEVASSSLGNEGPSDLDGDIGAENGAAYYLDGDVDEVAVYGSAVSTDTLNESYDVGAISASPYAAAVAAPVGLQDYWRLDESSGTMAVDQSGAHNGTYEGGHTLGVAGAITGDSDTAVALDGSTGSVQLPSLGTEADWTIEGWTDLGATATGYNALFAGDLGPRLLIGPTNVYADDLTTGAKVGAMSSSTPANTGGWVQWALVRDGSTLTIYRDGVAVDSSSLGSEGSTSLVGDLGVQSDGHYHLDGDLDEVAVYDDALTPGTVYDQYALGAYG
jgi:hypothetical protein